MEVSTRHHHDQPPSNRGHSTNLLNALSIVCQQEILSMEGKDDQKLIGGVARRDSAGRLVNVQDLRFRRFVSPTPGPGEEAHEQVIYSIEAQTIDQRRWTGPRDSVEPRYTNFDRMTDEVQCVRAGASDEPTESGRGTKPTQHSSYSSKLQISDVLPRMSLDAESPVSPSDSVVFLDEYPSSHCGDTSGKSEALSMAGAMEADDNHTISLCQHRCGAWFIERRYANLHEQDFCPNKPP